MRDTVEFYHENAAKVEWISVIDDSKIEERKNGETMKELRKLAKKFLTIPATSTPSERLFSKAGELINQRRSMLSDKNINMTLFLNKNIE